MTELEKHKIYLEKLLTLERWEIDNDFRHWGTNQTIFAVEDEIRRLELRSFWMTTK
ncbi:hypothetical protein UFOVP180_43 [uncultured Caudovirales phage]|uniref:Uncharacterized protein n=1 Tax=uncultured Caudovirales phage TaxID=2100421 RepID=A0A6J7WD95_9CAUD|nr:hypothetical protein UFOVP180_43 [uncultured Caudovirales phage]